MCQLRKGVLQGRENPAKTLDLQGERFRMGVWIETS